jgi:rhodanese-related sulfurtransferase
VKNDVKTILPLEAKKLLDSDPNALLVDVRSNMEFLFVGHPIGAIHVPWIDEPDWVINEHFSRDVRKLVLGGVSGDTEMKVPVLLICRSGKRSLDAGRQLIKDGFKKVYNIAEGFEGELDDHHHRSSTGGWRFHQLPWEQC